MYQFIYCTQIFPQGLILLLVSNKDTWLLLKFVKSLIVRFEPVSLLLAGSGFFRRGSCAPCALFNTQLYTSRSIIFESFSSLVYGPVNIVFLSLIV